MQGEILTWREILCEGPTTSEVFSKEFIRAREQFLSKENNLPADFYNDFVAQFEKIDLHSFDKIYLWFEYDLFCHINLAAVCSYLSTKEIKTPIYLVCSGTVAGSDKLFALPELNDEQLFHHFDNAIELAESHMEALTSIWKIYNAADHNKLLEVGSYPEALPYLSQCIQAHLRRFPDAKSGLNWMEEAILSSIEKNHFESERELISWMLQNQEYYGFGDLQIQSTVVKMKGCFQLENGVLKLSGLGRKVLTSEINIYEQLKDGTKFGGTLKYNYLYNINTKRLHNAYENS